MSDEIIAFVLNKENINSLQEKSMNKVLSRCKHAHFTDIHLRINGSDEIWEADWLKHLEQVKPINDAKEKLAKFGAMVLLRCNYMSKQDLIKHGFLYEIAQKIGVIQLTDIGENPGDLIETTYPDAIKEAVEELTK